MAPVTYIPNFMPEGIALMDFYTLAKRLAWIRHPDAPRSEYWTNEFDRPYTYGHVRGQRTYESQPEYPVITFYKRELRRYHHVIFEGCFLNYYKDGSDSLGWHADDDSGIDHNKPIVVVTLGNKREIQFRRNVCSACSGSGHYDNDGAPPCSSCNGTGKGEKESQMLENGSLLLMHAGMQQTHVHRIPKAGFVAGPRISLTFRGLK